MTPEEKKEESKKTAQDIEDEKDAADKKYRDDKEKGI